MPSLIKTCRACHRAYVAGETFCPADGSRLFSNSSTPDPGIDPLIGSTLDGRYRVLRLLGEGGMGRVYEAEHLLIERRVAIKVLREDFSRRAEVVERFRREAKSASRIGHPNIVDVLDFGQTPDGGSYFVMERLQGADLADVLARYGAVPSARAVMIAYQCCHALAAAHDKGIVHRDLKPENVFLIERDGVPDFVKLVDFGVAKMSEFDALKQEKGRLTRSGVIFGTPEYMSPEQAAGHAPDHRADIYALGITLYELLTGRVPFEGASFMSVLTKHANKPLPPMREMNPQLEISAELEAVILRALEKDPAARYQSAREMAAALQALPEMPELPFRLSLAPRRSSAPSNPDVSAHTPLSVPAVEAVAVPEPVPLPAPRARWVRFAVLAAACTGTLLVLAFMLAQDDGSRVDTAVVPERSREVAPEVAPAAATQGSEPAPGAQADAIAVGNLKPLVAIRISTEPSGAAVRVVGGAEVCRATPCAFEVVSGTPLALKASRGRAQAFTTVTPSGATDLHLVLDGGRGSQDSEARPTPPPTAASATTPVNRIRETDDLKVPEMYR